MVSVKPKLNQQTFDHMRRLMQEIKQTAESHRDAAIQAKIDLLDALLLRFVEDFISEDLITISYSTHSVWFATPHSE